MANFGINASANNNSNTSNSNLFTSGETSFIGGGEDILAELIKQLSGGGSAEEKAMRAERAGEVNTVQAERSGFSKEQAKLDATEAVMAQQRRALEELMPSINNAARGAGTSQSSMRALLIQDAAQKAADSSALLGIETIKDYGQISASLSSVLEALTRPDDTNTRALIAALEASKVSKTTSERSSSSNQPARSGISYASPGQSGSPWADMYRTTIDRDPFSPTFNMDVPKVVPRQYSL